MLGSATGKAAMRVAELLVLCAVALPGGCRTVTEEVLPDAPVGPGLETDRAQLLSAARERFAELPRTVGSVSEAFEMSSSVARLEHPDRYDGLVFASVCGLWLAQFTDEEELRSSSAERVIVLANTAVQLDADRVEGFYYRAIATGLFAQENQSYGLDAMDKIREDARTARKLDPSFDEGGPDRVLGLLYLRSPGAPTGVGSIRRAEFHLRKAYEEFPERAENPLYLAECEIERGADQGTIDALLDEFDRRVAAAQLESGAAPKICACHLEALKAEAAAFRLLAR